MVDVHCHLNFKAFTTDYDTLINQALEAGVSTIINVGTKLDSSQKAIELAQKYNNLYAIVGVHPHHADKVELGDNWIDELEDLAREPKVVAIGEIGLDNYRYQSNGIVDPKTQKEVFIAQIKLASRLRLPLQIHNRHAGEDIIQILKNHKSYLLDTPGMFHCFAGSKEVLKDALELGFYIGFDGNSTYAGLAPGEKVSLSELIELTPLDRIVTETDSPYLTPMPHRGSRNMPSYIPLIVSHIAKVKKLDFESVSSQTDKNARTLFKLAF